MKKIKKKNRIKIFERAYTKCARLEPGQTVKLAPMEREVLEEFLHRDWLRRLMAKEREKRREFTRREREKQRGCS